MNRFVNILKDVYYPNMDINYEHWQGSDSDIYVLYVTFPDPVTGEPQRGRTWLLEEEMTDSEVVLTAFKAILTAEEHETRENFRYKNAKIFNPHIDVDTLVELTKKKSSLDLRSQEDMAWAVYEGG